MRPYSLPNLIMIVCLFLVAGCKKDDADANAPIIKLSKDYVTGKSGKTIELTVDMTIPDGLKQLIITKGINLKPDNTFGAVPVTPVSTGTNTYRYNFSYVLSPDEVDQLVGFNFALADNKGRSVEKDLTVITTLSPAQIIFSKKWMLKSKFWESANPAAETIESCEKDNVFEWHRDSTITIGYGASGCTFDGFNVYDKWTLSDDEKTFTQIYHSLFDPANITIEKYNVRSISADRLVMDIVLDLSIFGPPYTDKEVFVYTYEAAP